MIMATNKGYQSYLVKNLIIFPSPLLKILLLPFLQLMLITCVVFLFLYSYSYVPTYTFICIQVCICTYIYTDIYNIFMIY